ncbi:MAG: aspartate--tRNA ligase [Firmicutes bacterium]|nr:aspartate--tRNA ligase [Bacillota bacterium]
MNPIYRDKMLNEINAGLVGKVVRVAGWANTIRDHGGITFIDLRDSTGALLQVVVESADILKGVSREACISVKGKLINRTKENINPALANGAYELVAQELDLLGAVTNTLPFDIDESKKVREDIRYKYRYLDLRNAEVRKNIELRSNVIKFLREQMHELGFMEIQTPIMTASSPEGARDYLIPSRLHPGKFYVLPQAPQQFKQLLMVGGFDKYFQIAPCFRDEDARADRTPAEFYQLDMEMAYATQDDVFAVGEKVLPAVFERFGNKKATKAPFPRITYKDSLEKYGTDKPDLRNPLIAQTVTDVFKDTNFNAFKNQTVRAICADNCAGLPRSFYDTLTTFMQEAGSKGLAWIKVEDGLVLNSPIAKFLSETEQKALLAELNAKPGSSIFLLAGARAPIYKLSGILRTELGTRLNLIDNNRFEFCWIVDFPMYELSDEGKIEFSHNPFSAPQGGLEALEHKNPLDILAYQYDIVCNGIELSSGAVRNHSPEVMERAFEIAGHNKSVLEEKFSAMYNAFKFGCPPHAGMAPGVDRMIMLLCDEPNLREVIVFPMNKSGQDLLMGAPTEVSAKQLSDVHISVNKEQGTGNK